MMYDAISNTQLYKLSEEQRGQEKKKQRKREEEVGKEAKELQGELCLLLYNYDIRALLLPTYYLHTYAPLSPLSSKVVFQGTDKPVRGNPMVTSYYSHVHAHRCLPTQKNTLGNNPTNTNWELKCNLNPHTPLHFFPYLPLVGSVSLYTQFWRLGEI